MNPEALCGELDLLVDHTRAVNLTPHVLLDLQTQIAAVRYSLAVCLVSAERKMLGEKDRRDLHLVRETLKLQAMDKKLSTAKAQDQVNDRLDTELIHQSVIASKIDHSAIKNRLDHSGDVMVAIAQRIKRLENEMIESRIQGTVPTTPKL